MAEGLKGWRKYQGSPVLWNSWVLGGMFIIRKGSDEEKRSRAKKNVRCPTCGTRVNWFRRMAHIHARMWLEEVVYAHAYEQESRTPSSSDGDEGPEDLGLGRPQVRLSLIHIQKPA
jgi:endogenous inhibitor of DNA gyrase (YacG/DUF329 family)